jgi:hypothetical protein
MGLLLIPQVIYECGEPRWNDINGRKPKINSDANPNLRGERKATNRLSYRTAYDYACLLL